MNKRRKKKWEKERRALQSSVDRLPPHLARDASRAVKAVAAAMSPPHAHCMASIYCGSGIVLACDSCWKRVFG